MNFIKSTIAAASVAACFVGNGMPANASDYKFEVDRFDGTQTATYTQEGSGCQQTDGIKGRANACLFINSTESSAYPIIGVMKVNKGWELLHTADRSGSAPAIITLTNGQVIRQSIPARLRTNTIYGGTVSEWVNLDLGKTNIPVGRIKTLEFKYGSAEFKVVPNRKAICALQRAKTCGASAAVPASVRTGIQAGIAADRFGAEP